MLGRHGRDDRGRGGRSGSTDAFANALGVEARIEVQAAPALACAVGVPVVPEVNPICTMWSAGISGTAGMGPAGKRSRTFCTASSSTQWF
jgi:hypothetical protein